MPIIFEQDNTAAYLHKCWKSL